MAVTEYQSEVREEKKLLGRHDLSNHPISEDSVWDFSLSFFLGLNRLPRPMTQKGRNTPFGFCDNRMRVQIDFQKERLIMLKV